MTTIAYKDGTVASDSYATMGCFVADNDCIKTKTVDKVQFWLSGYVNHEDLFIRCYLEGSAEDEELDDLSKVSAIIWDKPKGFFGEAGFDDEGKMWTYSAIGRVVAIGSGQSYAVGAMDAGASAKEAVKIASERDVYTGGKIRTYRVG